MEKFTRYALERVRHTGTRTGASGSIWEGAMTFVTYKPIPSSEEPEVARDLEAAVKAGREALYLFGVTPTLTSITFRRASQADRMEFDYHHARTVVNVNYRSGYEIMRDAEERVARVFETDAVAYIAVHGVTDPLELINETGITASGIDILVDSGLLERCYASRLVTPLQREAIEALAKKAGVPATAGMEVIFAAGKHPRGFIVGNDGGDAFLIRLFDGDDKRRHSPYELTYVLPFGGLVSGRDLGLIYQIQDHIGEVGATMFSVRSSFDVTEEQIEAWVERGYFLLDDRGDYRYLTVGENNGR